MTPEQVDRLITFGQMALEQGWYDQARKYFEQALAFDADNREAMKGLARTNEILSRRAAFEPMKPEVPVAKRVQPARPRRAGEPPTKQAGKKRWVALAVVIPALLLVLFIAYQRVQPTPQVDYAHAYETQVAQREATRATEAPPTPTLTPAEAEWLRRLDGANRFDLYQSYNQAPTEVLKGIIKERLKGLEATRFATPPTPTPKPRQVSRTRGGVSASSLALNILIVAALLGLIPAVIAYQKGKAFFRWWLFGWALFIIALPAAILLKPDVVELERRQLEQGIMKRCLHCAELVKREGKKHWLALAVVIPVLLLVLSVAYQRAQAPPAPTFENWSYLRAAAGIPRCYSEAYNLLADPDPQLALMYKTWESYFRHTLSVFRQCGEELRELQPPSQCARIHKDLVQMAEHFDHAVDLYAESQYENNDEKLFEAEQEFGAALRYMGLASDKIEQALK
jgi:hypothetical protein